MDQNFNLDKDHLAKEYTGDEIVFSIKIYQNYVLIVNKTNSQLRSCRVYVIRRFQKGVLS